MPRKNDKALCREVIFLTRSKTKYKIVFQSLLESYQIL